MLRTLKLGDDGTIPNNPDLPVLIYANAFPDENDDLAALMEQRFTENGWPPQWRNGIYAFHHYHCEGHEVLGIAAGEAEIVLGGEHGERLSLHRGDVLLLPAGPVTAGFRRAPISSSSAPIRQASMPTSGVRRRPPR